MPCKQADQEPVVVRPFNLMRATPMVGPWNEWIGTIRATLVIGADGVVIAVEMIEPEAPPLYLNQFRQEVHRMRFAAATRNCQPVVGTFLLTVRYRMD
jgi:hypothetical protein